MNRRYPFANRKHRGLVTLEFIFGFMVMFTCLMFWVELCVIGFLSSMVDYAVAESSRVARSSANANYATVFRSAIDNSDDVWTKIIDPEKFAVSVEYFSSFQDAATPPGSVFGVDKPIALYEVTYHYDPIFPMFFNEDNLTLTRQVFAIQEYERDQFSQ
ncbi:TadE/TadG family type IV pilus assembly protein [Enterovibrio paralichthyis]|uniref:TadE/TadG family type IV pilus assembly protein n=1 Tax=Enterovibrio paralichthyis TaxID=2853805 RepID=UPI0006D06543|nr:TadE/TadG family type IV pilus assembly protein [Enterovibrio paralichthyis]MBV7296472.1 pilus assembly protein [Enterovibrio paralichthyis]